MLSAVAYDQSIVLLELLPDGSSSLLIKSFDDLLVDSHRALPMASGSTEGAARSIDLRWALYGTDMGIKLFKLCAVLHTGFCRAMILPDKLVLFITHGDDSILAKVRSKLSEILNTMGDRPVFELAGLEAILFATSESLTRKIDTLRAHVSDVVKTVSKANENPLDDIRTIRAACESVRGDAIKLEAASNSFILDEEAMRGFCFFEAAAAHSLNADGETYAVEVLVESYLLQFDRHVRQIDALERELDLALATLTFKLDQARNKILTIKVLIRSLTSASSAAALCEGVFGMNLPSGIHHVPFVFWVVVALCLVGVAVSVVVFLHYLKRKKILID